MGKAGRPTKLTPELQEKICACIRKGNYASIACQACGITETTYYNWKVRGEKSKSGEFFEFLKSIKKAEAIAEEHLLGIVLNASVQNWQAAMTMLERRFPNRWGRKERIETKISGELKGTFFLNTPEGIKSASDLRKESDNTDSRTEENTD